MPESLSWSEAREIERQAESEFYSDVREAYRPDAEAIVGIRNAGRVPVVCAIFGTGKTKTLIPLIREQLDTTTTAVKDINEHLSNPRYLEVQISSSPQLRTIIYDESGFLLDFAQQKKSADAAIQAVSQISNMLFSNRIFPILVLPAKSDKIRTRAFNLWKAGAEQQGFESVKYHLHQQSVPTEAAAKYLKRIGINNDLVSFIVSQPALCNLTIFSQLVSNLNTLSYQMSTVELQKIKSIDTLRRYVEGQYDHWINFAMGGSLENITSLLKALNIRLSFYLEDWNRPGEVHEKFYFD